MRTRKTVASILIILIVIVVAVVVLQPFFTPDVGKAGLELSSDGNGKIYLTERHSEESFIYRVDTQGNVDAAIKVGGEVMATIYMGGHLYSFTYHNNAGRWTLEELPADLSQSSEVGSGEYQLIGNTHVLSSSENRVFITGNGEDGNHLVALSYNPGGQASALDDFASAEAAGVKGMSVYMQATVSNASTPYDLVCDGEAIYTIQINDKMSMITDEDTVRSKETYPDSWIYCREGTIFVLNPNTHEISTVDEFPNLTERYTYDRLSPGGLTLWNGGAAMLAKEMKGDDIIEGDMKLYFAESGSTNTWKQVYSIHVPFDVQMHLKDYMPEKMWIITIALAIAFIFSVMLAIFVRRIVLRVCATISVLGCFMLAVLCSLVWMLTDDIVLAELDAATGSVIHEYVAPEVSQVRVAFEAFCYGGIVLIVAIAVAVIFTSFSLRPLRDLTKRIGKFIEGDFTVNGMVSSSGDLGRMSRAVTEMGVSLAIKQYETDRMVESYNRFVPRDAERLLDRAGIMEVSTGDVARVDDCIAIVSVENRVSVMNTMDSRGFMTFVNSCFSRIFDCANRYKGALLSGEFLAVLPILFTERLGSNRGDVVRFGLELIDSSTVTGNASPEPDFFMLMHKTDFLYGIAGTNEKAFPFISSAELNFLYNCNTGLRGLGIRMAATQEYLDNLLRDDGAQDFGVDAKSGQHEPVANFAKRFIGIIQTPDGSREYRIYEMLDCLSDKERDIRLSYDEKVQSAIDLFYNNDFYTAMVEFSSILKQNPKDGLIRWYAFACERYFNAGDIANVRYDLLNVEGK
jgi:hypothetical protein